MPAVDMDVVVGQEDATTAETSHIPCAVCVHCRTMHVLDSPHVHSPALMVSIACSIVG